MSFESLEDIDGLIEKAQLVNFDTTFLESIKRQSSLVEKEGPLTAKQIQAVDNVRKAVKKILDYRERNPRRTEFYYQGQDHENMVKDMISCGCLSEDFDDWIDPLN